MDTDIVVAIIAGAVSLVVSLITSFISANSIRKETERKITNQFTDKLYSLRLERYPDAFVITDKIQEREKPQKFIESEELKNISKELFEWKKGITSLVISKRSLEKFYELRDALNENYGFANTFTDSQVKKIMKARNEFRGSLRQDIGYLYEED